MTFRKTRDINALRPRPISGRPAHSNFKIRIRPARPADKDFIGNLSRRVFNVYGPYGDTVIQWFESGTAATLVAVIQRKPVGFAMVGYSFDHRTLQCFSELLAIAVEPESQRMGVGRMLLRAIETKATELDYTRLFLHTAVGNLGARKLFLASGYHPWEIRKGFYPAGQDAVMMFKDIGTNPVRE
jgi:ribosomal protein S18 acetylase RimI-like enzyme